VLIVDNAAMPSVAPCALTLGKIPLEVKEVTTDSMAFYYCQTLGERIADAHRYDDVRLYDKAYRPAHLSDQPLSASEVRQLCTDEGVDAVISLDRLQFSIKGDVNPLYFLRSRAQGFASQLEGKAGATAVVAFTPQQKSNISRVVTTFQTSNGIPTQLVFTAKDKSVLTARVAKVSPRTAYAASFFTLSAKSYPGCEVVDLR